MRDAIEAAIWLAIFAAYATHAARRHRRQTREDRQKGRYPPPFQW